MKALIIIDYTNDFIADTGNLTTGKSGQEIEEKITTLAQEFTATGDFVVCAVDYHDQSDAFHPENRLFPPHNLVGTSGRQLYGLLNHWYQEHRLNQQIYWLDKRHYSAFSGTDLDIRLRERGITEIHLVGVCTDICVLHTAVDAYNLGYQIVCHKQAVASFNAVGHQWALEHFQNTLGAEIME